MSDFWSGRRVFLTGHGGLAAQRLLLYFYANLCVTYCTNIIRAVQLLRAVRPVNSVGAVLNVASDKCYEKCKRISTYRENDRLGRHDPYSTAVMDDRHLLRDFLESIFEHWGHRRELRYSDSPLAVSKPPAFDCTDARKLFEWPAAWETERPSASKITLAQISSWHAEL